LIELAILAEVRVVTIRETAISKIQQLPESLMQEIIDFIDFITRNHQAKTAIDLLEGDRSESWARWFEATDGLEITPEITPTVPTREYQQRLLHKYHNKDSTCDSLQRWSFALLGRSYSTSTLSDWRSGYL